MAAAACAELLDRYMEPLLAGRRQACRELIRQALEGGSPAETIYRDVLWPAMVRVEQLFREDRIGVAAEHMATRINRLLTDQVQPHLARVGGLGKRILIMCAPQEPEDLGAQMCADLFEAEGWDVYFVGGGVPDDEILHLAGQLRPDILLVFGTRPEGVPAVRRLIDLIREVGAVPHMNVMISGGVFNRAEGLWEEVNADLFAATAEEALGVARDAKPREPSVRTVGAMRKRRRRRRSPYLTAAEATV